MDKSLCWYMVASYFGQVVIIRPYLITGETQYVRDGDDVTLSCYGVMHAVVRWTYSQNGLSENITVANDIGTRNATKYSIVYNREDGVYNFTVHTFLKTFDAGQYFCQLALNGGLEKETRFTVTVPEGPSTALITGNSPVFADGTISLTLTCTAPATPGVIFQCRYSGTITGGSTGTLTLSHVQASDNGANITCTAINSVHADIQTSAFFIPVVHYGPHSASITGNVPVYADSRNTMTLICTTTPSNPGVIFQWTKRGINIGDNSHTLTFTPELTDDGEDVVCIAKNSQHTSRQATQKVSLIVHYGPKSVNITAGPVYADGTNRLTLTCTAEEYNPDVGFQWKEGNQNITRQNTNTYTKIADKTDNGRILTCLTWNTLYTNERRETSTQLTVYYAPSGLTITGYEDAQILRENDNIKTTVILNCTAIGFPEPTLTWNGICSSNSGTVTSVTSTVQIARSINQKTCTCAGIQSNTPWTGQSDVTFTVHFGPSSIKITTGDNKLIENNNVDITCTTTEANPTKGITWYNGTNVLTVNSPYNRQTGNNYGTVTSQTWNRQLSWYDNKSVIKCTTTNQLGDVVSDSTELDVKYGAKDTSIKAPPEISEGNDVTIICSCRSNPDPIFSITGSTLSSSNNRLEIMNISRTDGGEYSCTAGNAYYMESKTTTVVVNYPPDVTVIYENATENDTGTTITCVVAGKPHSYTFSSWKHIAPDGQTIIRELQGVHKEDQLTLKFPKSVSYEDSGYYECTVNNGVKGRSLHLNQTNMSAYFIIEGPPKILEKEDSAHGDLGDVVNIEVGFYSVPEYISVNWYMFDGSQLAVSHHNIILQATYTLEATFHGHSVKVYGYVTTLKFDNVKASDFVSFRVVVSNTEGSASFVKTLKGTTWPDIPTQFRIASITSTSVSVTWLSGDNGGASQVFRIQHRETLTDGTDNHWQTHDVQEIPNSRTYAEEIINLTPDTIYDLRMYSKNEEGESDKTSTYVVKTVTRVQDDSLVSIVVGSVLGSIVLIMVLVLGFLWKRRVLKVSWNNIKKKDDPSHVYQNSSFSAVVEDVASDGIENAYQPIGPTENPNMHYQTLDSITPTDRVEPTETLRDKTYVNA